MSIHKIGSDLVRPLPSRESGQAEKKTASEAGASQARKPRTDQVGFSAEGLAMAERALEVRITNGFYDDPQVAEEVARRLLASGDLDYLT